MWVQRLGISLPGQGFEYSADSGTVSTSRAQRNGIPVKRHSSDDEGIKCYENKYMSQESWVLTWLSIFLHFQCPYSWTIADYGPGKVATLGVCRSGMDQETQ